MSSETAAATGAGTRSAWAVEAALFPLQVAIGLNFFAPAPLFPAIMDDLGLSRGTVSLLIAAVTLVLAATTIPAGFVAARLGLKRTLILSGLLMAAGVLAPLAPGFIALVLLRLLFGLGMGLALPATSSVVMQWFTPKHLSLLNGLNLTGQSIGVALSMFSATLLEDAGGWQLPIFIYGACAFAAMLLWAVFGRNPATTTGLVASLSWPDLRAVLRSRTTLLLQLAATGTFSMYVAFTSWLPSYYHEERGMTLEEASAVTALLPLVGIGATLLGGMLPMRVRRRRPLLMVPGVLICVCGYATFLVSGDALIYVSVILMGVVSWLYLPILFTIPMELPLMSPHTLGLTIGATLAAGNLASFLSPIAVGVSTDLTGSYLPSLAVLATMSLALVVSAYLLPETGGG